MRRWFLLTSILIAGLVPTNLFAWEIETHQAISSEAIDASRLDHMLRFSLGFDNGVDSLAQDSNVALSIRDWIREGSKREDDFTFWPFGRFLNHFHHPLRSWTAAGLNDIFTGQSSAIWAQTRNQPAANTGSWSWQETRDR
jgi:hypothetical protein